MAGVITIQKECAVHIEEEAPGLRALLTPRLVRCDLR